MAGVRERDGVEGDDLRNGDGEPRERDAESQLGSALQCHPDRDEPCERPDRCDDDVPGLEVPGLEDCERRGVRGQHAGNGEDRGVQRTFLGLQPAQHRLEQAQDPRERGALPRSLDHAEDDRGECHREQRRRAGRGMMHPREEVIRARLERKRMHERGREVRERRQLESAVTCAPREPGKQRGLRRPGVGDRGAGQDLRDADGDCGEAENADEQRRLAGPPEQACGERKVDRAHNQQRDALPRPVVEQRGGHAAEEGTACEKRRRR